MKQNNENPLLDQPLSEFGLSMEFAAMCDANHFNSLRDILTTPFHELPHLPKSSFRLLKELLDLLTKHELTDLFDD